MRKNILLLLLSIAIFDYNLYSQQIDTKVGYLIQQAIEVSPGLKELHNKKLAAEAVVPQVSNLPDPVLTLGLTNLPTNSFSFTQEPMTGKIIGLNQAIPFPGELSSASRANAIDTSIIRQEINDLKNKIRNDVISLYYDLRVKREEKILANESKKLLQQISEVVRSKYEVSEASLQNIIQVEVQITRIQDKIEELKGAELALVSELNAILLRDENTQIITGQIPSIDVENYSTSSLLSLATDYRPFLKGIKLWEQKSKLIEEQAEYQFYPNFKFGVQFTQRDYLDATGMDLNNFLSFVVGISLPINYGGKKSASVNEAQFMQMLYRDKFNSSLQSLQQSFGKISAKLTELKSREKLVAESLLPQALELFNAALADYQVAKIDFVNVINAENDILKIKTQLINIRTGFYKNLAQLEFLTGKKLIKDNS